MRKTPCSLILDSWNERASNIHARETDFNPTDIKLIGLKIRRAGTRKAGCSCIGHSLWACNQSLRYAFSFWDAEHEQQTAQLELVHQESCSFYQSFSLRNWYTSPEATRVKITWLKWMVSLQKRLTHSHLGRGVYVCSRGEHGCSRVEAISAYNIHQLEFCFRFYANLSDIWLSRDSYDFFATVRRACGVESSGYTQLNTGS